MLSRKPNFAFAKTAPSGPDMIFVNFYTAVFPGHKFYTVKVRNLRHCLVTTKQHQPVDQAGLERTEAGESAPSRHEDSPRPGRAKCELCETLQDLIMGAGEEASINLPCLLILASSWTARPSRPYSSELQATRGTLCCAAILPF